MYMTHYLLCPPIRRVKQCEHVWKYSQYLCSFLSRRVEVLRSRGEEEDLLLSRREIWLLISPSWMRIPVLLDQYQQWKHYKWLKTVLFLFFVDKHIDFSTIVEDGNLSQTSFIIIIWKYKYKIILSTSGMRGTPIHVWFFSNFYNRAWASRTRRPDRCFQTLSPFSQLSW